MPVMKKCPKCGAENREDSSACCNCLTLLSGLSTSQPDAGKANTGPARPQPGRRLTDTLQLSKAPAPSQQPTAPVPPPVHPGQNVTISYPAGSPPNPYGPSLYPGSAEYPIPSARKSSAGLVLGIMLMAAILTGGIIFAFWQYRVQPESPVGAVRAFLKAAAENDHQAAYNCTSQASQKMSDLRDIVEGVEQFLVGSGELKHDAPQEGSVYVLDPGYEKETTACVRIKLSGRIKDRLDHPLITKEMKSAILEMTDKGLPVFMVKEDGNWKIDVVQTKIAAEDLEKRLMKMMGLDPAEGQVPLPGPAGTPLSWGPVPQQPQQPTAPSPPPPSGTPLR